MEPRLVSNHCHRSVVDQLSRLWGVAGEVAPDVIAFCETLVWGVAQNLDTVDEMIRAASKNWRVERMSRVDRNLLRLACCELHFLCEAPANVVFNEAIELAKRFGTAESASFVNGLLDKIVRTASDEDSGEASPT